MSGLKRGRSGSCGNGLRGIPNEHSLPCNAKKSRRKQEQQDRAGMVLSSLKVFQVSQPHRQPMQAPMAKELVESKMAKAESLYSNFTIAFPKEYSIGGAPTSSGGTLSRVEV